MKDKIRRVDDRVRGTRPKYSVTTTHLVYCDRCDASYNVLKSKNVDQWLNLHWLSEEEDEEDIDSDDIHESEVEDVNQAGNEGDY